MAVLWHIGLDKVPKTFISRKGGFSLRLPEVLAKLSPLLWT